MNIMIAYPGRRRRPLVRYGGDSRVTYHHNYHHHPPHNYHHYLHHHQTMIIVKMTGEAPDVRSDKGKFS